jgi:hypothetical protein
MRAGRWCEGKNTEKTTDFFIAKYFNNENKKVGQDMWPLQEESPL